jgi:hypothetical protein
MQFEVERFVIWNQAALLRNVDSSAVPVQHFGHELGEYSVAKFNAYVVIQIVNSHAGCVIYPGLPLTRMRKPVHTFLWILNIRFGVIEKVECVRTSLHEGHGCRLHDAMLGAVLLASKGRMPSPFKHKAFTVATDVQVFFCDPQSPWQRGTNENTNLLLRQYFPRGTDLAPITQAQLDQVELRLNQRPRKTLGFQTPASKLQASVASTI